MGKTVKKMTYEEICKRYKEIGEDNKKKSNKQAENFDT